MHIMYKNPSHKEPMINVGTLYVRRSCKIETILYRSHQAFSSKKSKISTAMRIEERIYLGRDSGKRRVMLVSRW